ncbi:MAG: endonuclease III [Epsilonproteobacteria bacterium]|nr:endonuclease III [Campylobacterota bacterium]NPA64326.1 endonuclease III [Campylobacterota bacterium]
MVRRKPKEIEEIKRRFLEHYPKAKTELNYKNLYELLVAVMLSAQCTDKRVNIITPKFFERFPTIEALAKADIEEVKELIKTCSFFNNKAKNLVEMAKMVMEKYGGKIPEDEKELIKLPGVGQKTAHVVMIEYLGKNLMAVDTHVFRVAHRLGLSDAKTPEKTEEDLVKAFKSDLPALHQAMVLFGRYICTAKNPKCEKCFLYDLCKSENKKPISSKESKPHPAS